ncbi:MAG: hypothetical protein ACD_20C00174G0009 [uncultured bacterium]|nr:MAG: hypothetical protein ACD_20C00174G0009 [uncultured bacterium]
MYNYENSRENPAFEEALLIERLSNIKNKIVVLSGKGGVGKSTVAANLAMSLALSGFKTGLLDIDIHGPSIPTLLGLEDKKLQGTDSVIYPYTYGDSLKVISIGFLLANTDDPIIWRGPEKMGIIQRFIQGVEWGELDYLIVDCPPGTGDEPLSIIQTLDTVTGAVIVTTPQKLAISDVRKSVNFCKKLNVPVIGVIENMSGYICPDCNKTIEIFKSGGGETMAHEMNVPFLGKIPLDPNIVEAGDSGKPFVYFYAETPTGKIMENIINPIINYKNSEEKKTMRFAIPTANGKLCTHFGHCEVFTFIDVDPDSNIIIAKETITPPEHQPGILPPWIAEQGASIIIAGGMGERARVMFEEYNIKVVVGAQADEPEQLVKNYLNNNLLTGINTCDHGECAH